ncbi:MAG: flavoprotein [Firmicutes bacterium]|nr:flavoprotein [Bacillota bacterium]
MDEERMLRLVTEEVLRVLLQKGFAKDRIMSSMKMLVVFTGGMIGLQEAFAALRTLKDQGAELTAVLSPAAEKVIGLPVIKEQLGKEVAVITEVTANLYEVIRHTDLVLVPVLTQNSLAKLVHLIYDTVATEVILRAIQFGKKVIAARNAADPLDSYRVQTGMAKAPEKLLRKMQGYMGQVEEYGIKLVDAKELGWIVQQVLQTENSRVEISKKSAILDLTYRNKENRVAAGVKGKPILNAAQVQKAISSGEDRVVLVQDTLITPLAKELAQEAGIEIVIMD